MFVHLTPASANKKTGPIPVSTTEEASCPTSCSWYGKGCYAKYGPLALHWRKVPERGMTWANFCKAIKALPRGILWRHNQAGDLPGKNKRINLKELLTLVSANKGKRGFTYTHKPMDVADNRYAVRLANAEGFTVNLSADNIEQADSFVELGIAPVCVVLPASAESQASFLTPKGNRVVVCPAARNGIDMNCQKCQLCAIPSRKSIIGFPAHGTAAKTVSQRASLNVVE